MKKLIFRVLAVQYRVAFLIIETLIREPLKMYFLKLIDGQVDASILPTTLLLLVWNGISVFFYIGANELWNSSK